jgi:predicted transcriptional regulator
MAQSVPFRKRRILDDDDDDDDDHDAYSSSSASFQSPAASGNEDDDGDYFQAPPDNTSKVRNTFALPAGGDSQDDSTLEGQHSPGLGTQPFKTQPSTPSATATTTTTTTAAAKAKRRKVSMSPTDSLAQNENNDKNRRTSPRRSPQSKLLQEVIEIEDDDDDDTNTNTNTNLGMIMEDAIKMPNPRKKDKASEPVIADKVNATSKKTGINNVPKESRIEETTPSSKAGSMEAVPKLATYIQMLSKPSSDEKKMIGKKKSPSPERIMETTETKAVKDKAREDSVSKQKTKPGVKDVPKGSRQTLTPSSKVPVIEAPEKQHTGEMVIAEDTTKKKSGKRKADKVSSPEAVAVRAVPSKPLAKKTPPEPPKVKEASKASKKSDLTKAKKKKTTSAAAASENENVSPANGAAIKTNKAKKKIAQQVQAEASAPPPKKKDKKVASAKAKSKVETVKPSTVIPPESSKEIKSKATSKSSKVSDAKPPDKEDSTKAAKPAPVEAKKPTTKKKKRSFQDELLHLMFMSCKPYTVKSLAQQMKTNESSVNFCMLSLTDKGWIVKKEFTSKGGRSKELYWANQTAKSKELYDALRIVLPHQMQAAQEELAQLQQDEKERSHQLAQLTDGPSNEELDTLLTSAQSEVSALKQKLEATQARVRQATATDKPAPLKGGRKQPPAKKNNCPKRLKIRINQMRDEWRKRKNKCMDFIDQLADGMEKKVKDVVKLLELETDEEEGVKMPPKHNLD